MSISVNVFYLDYAYFLYSIWFICIISDKRLSYLYSAAHILYLILHNGLSIVVLAAFFFFRLIVQYPFY